ncbi:MAG: hypothetical protein CMP11_08505 [Zetaproteobacteria bacterium]|nr:hypothetical protein [Pseudobdellovibrionaceae bacterium]
MSDKIKKESQAKKEIDRIAHKTFERGASFLNLSLQSGLRFTGYKLKNFLNLRSPSVSEREEFLKSQAIFLVKELEKLKGSIMKAGQMLSVYGEHFFPKEVNSVLKSLQSESKPIVWKEIEKVLRLQFDQTTLDKIYIDKKPIAAASLGQVYQGKFLDKKLNLAIKIQYPGVDKAIDSDLKVLKKVLLLSGLVSRNKGFDDIYKEIKMMLHYEVDYKREFETLKAYQKAFNNDKRFVIPEVFSDFSSRRVLCMTYEEGFSLDSPQVLNLSQERRNKLAISFLDLFLKEVFVLRTVQTDPHFGNYKVRLSSYDDKEDQVVLLDFGAVRKFSKKYISSFAQLIFSCLQKNHDLCVTSGKSLGFLYEDDPQEALDLFTEICFEVTEGFNEEFSSEEGKNFSIGKYPYDWKRTDLIERLTEKAKGAIFTFKLRPPPREAVFLDRKLVGTYTILRNLGFLYGPRKLLMKYIEPYCS